MTRSEVVETASFRRRLQTPNRCLKTGEAVLSSNFGVREHHGRIEVGSVVGTAAGSNAGS